MVKNTKLINIDNYNLKLTKVHSRYLIGLVVLLLLILVFINNYDTNIINKNYIIERVLVFMIIFILTVILSKNFIISVVVSIILFLLINLLMTYRYTMENYQNESTDIDKKEDGIDKDKKTEINLSDIAKIEPAFDKNIFDTDSFKQSTMGIQDLLKKVNGGIELKEDDLKETDKLGVDTKKYGDDKNMNPLKHAQKEAYELIDTVNALKDTVNTLAPVLSEGRKLMDIFQNLKL